MKTRVASRVPASFLVSISYMFWASVRQGVRLDSTGQIQGWPY